MRNLFSIGRHPVWLTVPSLLLLLVALGYPLAQVVLRSFTDPAIGLDNYVWFFSRPVNLTVFWRTFEVAGWVTILCLVLGYPYAWMMTAVGPRMRLLLILCVLVPFWVSGVVRTLAWVILLQDSGVINRGLVALGFEKVRLIRTPLGVIIGMTQVLLPFMIMPLYAVMRSIALRLVQAARSLGATSWTTFRRVYLPQTLPGIAAGSLLVFILAVG